MKKKQTRRAISIRSEVYDRIKAQAGASGSSMSAIVERIIADGLASDRKRKPCE